MICGPAVSAQPRARRTRFRRGISLNTGATCCGDLDLHHRARTLNQTTSVFMGNHHSHHRSLKHGERSHEEDNTTLVGSGSYLSHGTSSTQETIKPKESPLGRVKEDELTVPRAKHAENERSEPAHLPNMVSHNLASVRRSFRASSGSLSLRPPTNRPSLTSSPLFQS